MGIGYLWMADGVSYIHAWSLRWTEVWESRGARQSWWTPRASSINTLWWEWCQPEGCRMNQESWLEVEEEEDRQEAGRAEEEGGGGEPESTWDLRFLLVFLFWLSLSLSFCLNESQCLWPVMAWQRTEEDSKLLPNFQNKIVTLS